MSDAHGTSGMSEPTEIEAEAAPSMSAELCAAIESLALATGAARDPSLTLGEVKAQLAAFARSHALSASAELPGELQEIYELLCTEAVALGIDPLQALQRQLDAAARHRPQLVSPEQANKG